MLDNYFVFKIQKFKGSGYKYGIYNKDHEKWSSNIIFEGTEEECINFKNNLNE